jgi:hypothetical protein
MKPRLVRRGVWILAREFIFLIALLYDNQYILTAVVHENDNNLTKPQTGNNRLCNTYSTNIISFFWTQANGFQVPTQIIILVLLISRGIVWFSASDIRASRAENAQLSATLDVQKRVGSRPLAQTSVSGNELLKSFGFVTELLNYNKRSVNRQYTKGSG